jgi:hypothetical protein
VEDVMVTEVTAANVLSENLLVNVSSYRKESIKSFLRKRRESDGRVNTNLAVRWV